MSACDLWISAVLAAGDELEDALVGTGGRTEAGLGGLDELVL